MKKSAPFIKSLLNDDSKRIFIYTFLCGVAAHGSMMFNKFSWHTDLARGLLPMDTERLIAMGRWMRVILSYIVARGFGDVNLSIPLFHGLVSLLMIAASACLIARIFDIRGKYPQFVLGGLMAVFPVVTSTFGFMLAAPYYFFGVFLAVAAVYAAIERKGIAGFVIGTACLFCSIGIYQAYLDLSVSLFVIALIVGIVRQRYGNLLNLIKSGLYYLSICICAFILYYVIWKLFQKVFNVAPDSYQGMSSLGRNGLHAYLGAVVTAYKRFVLIFDTGWENLYPLGLGIVQKGIIVLSALGAVYLVIRQLRQNIALGIAMGLLIAMLPLCFNLIYVMASTTPDSLIHTVMLYGQVALYIFLICCVQLLLDDGKKVVSVFRGIAIAALILMLTVDVYYDNACYMKAEVVQQQTISNLTVLVSRIKSTEGYKDTMPVCFTMNGKRDKTLEKNSTLSKIDIYPFDTIFKRHDSRALTTYLKYWCGFSPNYASASKFTSLPEVEAMPDYPDDGSIQIINDTVVIKW